MPALLACCAATSLGLAACGGDSESGSGDKGGTINVGSLVPLTGEYGGFGKSWQQAVDMVVTEANATGALPGGAKLKNIVGDEKSNAEAAVEAARKMIDTQDVVAIVGPTSSPMLALEPIAKRARVPMLSTSAGTVALSKIGGEYLFRTVPSDDDDRIAMTKFLASKGTDSISMFVENSASPISTSAAFKETFEAGGGTITGEVRVNPGESSYRAAVGKILADDPKWILCSCSQQAGTSILKELSAAGYKGDRLVTPDLTSSDSIKAVGVDAMQGAFGELPAADTTLPGFKKFEAAYKERFGGSFEPFTANTYDAMAIVVLAMIAGDSAKGEDIAKNLVSVANAPGKKVATIAEAAEALKAGEEIDYDGASGPIEFDETGTAVSSYAILRAEGAEWKQAEFFSADDIAAAKK